MEDGSGGSLHYCIIKNASNLLKILAGGRGVEPRFTESESAGTIKELTNKVKHDKRTVKKIKVF